VVKVAAFDRYASSYQETVEGSLSLPARNLDFFALAKIYHIRRLARTMPRPLSVCSVLDVGCGTGRTDQLLLPHVGSLSGVDVSAGMVTQARARNPDARYWVYDGAALPFDDRTFDMAFAICVVHHVDPPGWDGFLAELWRVTREGGLSVVIEHNPVNPLTRRSVDRCPFDEDAVLVRPRRVTEGFRRAGARNVGQRYILFAPFGRDRVRQLESALSWFPAGAQHVVWARREAAANTHELPRKCLRNRQASHT
jgi:ubiquinone/menaquinone biosynthesis C-methylase UbiE